MSTPARQVRPSRPPARGKNLRAVRAHKRGLLKRRAPRRVTPVLVVGLILCCGVVFGVLLEQVVLAQTGFKVAALRDQMAKAENEHADLVLRAAKLASSERIERVAIHRLGMVAPEDVRYIVANVSTGRNEYLAQQEEPDLSSDQGAASGELGGLSP